MSRFLIRKLATTMRTRLCMKPVRQSSRMPASTSGTPVRPCRQRLKVLGRVPLECVELRPVVDGGQVGMVEQDVVVELTPAKLAQELRDVALRGGGHIAVHAMPHLERAELAEREAGTQAAGHVTGGNVAVLVVREALFNELLETVVGSSFPGRPRFSQPIRPIRMLGEQVPVVELLGTRFQEPHAWRCGNRIAHVEFPSCPPERCEDLERLALSRADRPRLEEQVGMEAGRGQQLLERRIDVLGGVRTAGSRTPPPRRPPRRAPGAPRRLRPCATSRAARAHASEWCSHQRLAAPMGRTPGDCSSRR